jgi:hypothetical protein
MWRKQAASASAARVAFVLILSFCLTGSFSSTGSAAQAIPIIHGMWVWKSPTVLAAPGAIEALRDFCKAQEITEIYVSISESSKAAEENDLTRLITEMHHANLRVEALLSSTEADEPGKHRETLLEHVREIVQFNSSHPADRFDGIHLDIEPQQRPENKGAGNLRFLPGLADAFREATNIAAPAGMTTNADIQNKLLKGDLSKRNMLLTSVPRVTLMMYELSNPDDGQTAAQKAAKAAESGQKYLQMAYEGLNGSNLAKMGIALRTPDYGDLLPQMLHALDAANRDNPHYLGWARHSYNDVLK